MRQLLSAVTYLHERQVVHRDLKPENVLLERSGGRFTIKITDFGLAKLAPPEGFRTFCGTPAYFAPEVLLRRWGTSQGYGRYGPASDVWSVGMIMYVILTGRNPFNPEKLYDVIENLKNLELKEADWSTVSSAAKHLVKSLLTPDPDDRITAKAAELHLWLITEGPVDDALLPLLPGEQRNKRNPSHRRQ